MYIPELDDIAKTVSVNVLVHSNMSIFWFFGLNSKSFVFILVVRLTNEILVFLKL